MANGNDQVLPSLFDTKYTGGVTQVLPDSGKTELPSLFDTKYTGSPKDTDSFFTNFGEGLEQGGKQLVAGTKYALADIGQRFTEDDLWAQEIKNWSKDYVASAPAPDDSVGQFLGSLVPSTVPSALAIGSVYVSGGATAPAVASWLAAGGLGLASAGQGMMDYDAYKESIGEAGTPTGRALVGLSYAASEFVMEKFALSKHIPNPGKYILRGNVEAAEEAGKALVTRYAKQSKGDLVKLMKKIGTASAVEGAQESLTELAQAITENAYRDMEDRYGVGEIAARMKDAAIGGAIMGTGLGGLSYKAQDVVHNRRRNDQGFVRIGKFNGEGVEVLGMDKDNKLQIMYPDGNTNEVDPNQVTETVNVSPDQFRNLLKGKTDETNAIERSRIEFQNQAKQQFDAEFEGKYRPGIKQAEDGQDILTLGMIGEAEMVVVDETDDGQSVYVVSPQTGGAPRLVAKKDLDNLQTATVDQWKAVQAPELQVIPDISLPAPVVGEEIDYTDGPGRIIAYDAETGDATIEYEKTLQNGDVETIPITPIPRSELDTYRKFNQKAPEKAANEAQGLAEQYDEEGSPVEVPIAVEQEIAPLEIDLEDQEEMITANAVEEGVYEIMGKKKKEAAELMKAIAEEYPNLAVELVDKTDKTIPTAKANFVVQIKTKKNDTKSDDSAVSTSEEGDTDTGKVEPTTGQEKVSQDQGNTGTVSTPDIQEQEGNEVVSSEGESVVSRQSKYVAKPESRKAGDEDAGKKPVESGSKQDIPARGQEEKQEKGVTLEKKDDGTTEIHGETRQDKDRGRTETDASKQGTEEIDKKRVDTKTSPDAGDERRIVAATKPNKKVKITKKPKQRSYNQLSKAEQQGVNRIVEKYVEARETRTDLSAKEKAITEYSPKVRRDDFIRTNDKVNIVTTLAKTYFKNDALGLDQQAMEINERHFGGQEVVTPADLADFMVANPKGPDLKGKVARDLEQEYYSITGKELNIRTAKGLADKFGVSESEVNKVINEAETLDFLLPTGETDWVSLNDAIKSDPEIFKKLGISSFEEQNHLSSLAQEYAKNPDYTDTSPIGESGSPSESEGISEELPPFQKTINDTKALDQRLKDTDETNIASEYVNPFGPKNKPIVEKEVAKFRKKYPNAPEIVVMESHLDLQLAFPNQPFEDLYYRNAFYNPNDGKAYVVASAPRFKTSAMVEQSLLHEVIGHYGVRKALDYAGQDGGKKFNDFMEQVFDKYKADPLLTKIYDSYKNEPQIANTPLDKLSDKQKVFIAEEYVAHISETNTNKTLIQEIVDWFRDLLGLDPSMSNDMVRDIIANGRRMVEAGTQMVSREPLLPSNKMARFQLSVFHGSPHTFDQFSTANVGGGRGKKNFGWGLYFTDREGIAKFYAGYQNQSGSRNLYKVNIHQGKEPGQYDYVDWSKPLTDGQKSKLSTMMANTEGTGQEVYQRLSGMLGSDKEASLAMLRVGIDGIQYPNSLMVRDGEGTNYVVFDDQAVTISEAVRFQKETKDNFYSNSLHAIRNVNQGKATGDQWKAMLLNNGASQSELDWIGFDDFLKDNPKPTKEEVYEFIRANQVEVVDVVLGQPSEEEIEIFLNDEAGEGLTREEAIEFLSDGEYAPKYPSYQLPGGTDYKELLLTMPHDYSKPLPEHLQGGQWAIDHGYNPETIVFTGKPGNAEWEKAVEEYRKTQPQPFKSSHWDEPNILAHIRFNSRVVNGEDVLFIEEIQSDWAQEGRKKGFKQDLDHLSWDNDGVPNMPFPQTSQWLGLALKRMIRYASENGYNRIAWINGEQSADRYDLSKQINMASLSKSKDGSYRLVIEDKRGDEIDPYRGGGKTVTPQELEDTVGKDLAAKLIEGADRNFGKPWPKNVKENPEFFTLRGLDLKVGGEGMVSFYDRIVPSTTSKLLKKLDKETKIEPIKLNEKTNRVTKSKVFNNQKDALEFEKSLRPDQYKIGETLISNPDGTHTVEWKEMEASDQQSFPITPVMRQKAIQQGLPMFQKTYTPLEHSGSQKRQILDAMLYKYQDRQIYLKRLIEMKEKQGREITDSMNAYSAENRSTGIIQEKLTQFHEKYASNLDNTIIGMTKQDGVTYDEISRYLKAKHIWTDKVENGGFDNLKGEDSIEAAGKYVEEFESKVSKKNVDQLIHDVKAITHFVREKEFEYGMKTKAEYDRLESMNEFYVPLRGFEGLEDQDHTYRTKDYKRKGRVSESGDPIPYMMVQAQTAIVEGEQNRVKQALLEFVRMNPDGRHYRILESWYLTDPKTGNVSAIYRRPTQDEFDNFNATRTEPLPEDMTMEQYKDLQRQKIFEKDTITVKVDGKKVVMEFMNPRVTESFKRQGIDQLPKWLQWSHTAVAFLRKAYTQYSPEFGFRNLIRDGTTGLINVRNDFGVNVSGKVLKNTPSATRAVKKGLLNRDFAGAEKLERDEWMEKMKNPKAMSNGELMRLFLEMGGLTGYSDMKDVATIRKEMLEKVEGMKDEVKAISDIKKAGKVAFKYTLGALDDFNRVTENIMRFSTFKTLIEEGMSPEKAALYAKDVTVNFNRKGSQANAIGGLYLFWNASIQGNERLLRPFGLLGPTDNTVRRRAISTALTLPALYLGLSMINRLIGGEDDDGEYYFDKLSEYDKTHNLIIPTGVDGKFARIPLPYGYNVFFAWPAHVTDALMGKETFGGAALNTAALAMDSFSPLGAPQFDSDLSIEGKATQFFAPTIAKAPLEVAFNNNFMGTPIYKDQSPYDTPRPDSEMHFSSVDPIMKAIASSINEATGGDSEEPGFVDINPEVIEHYVSSYTGGLGKFLVNSAATTVNLAQHGTETFTTDRVKQVPFVRGFVTQPSPGAYRAKFYDQVMEIEAKQDIYNRYKKAGNRERATEYREENMNYLRMANMAKAYNEKVKKLTDLQRRYETMGRSEDAENVEKRLKDTYTEFNKQYKKSIQGKPLGFAEWLGLN